MVLAPEHPLVDLFATDAQKDAIAQYRAAVSRQVGPGTHGSVQGENRRLSSGAFAVNPVNGERIPVWIADYVLSRLRHRRDHGRARARRAGFRVRAASSTCPSGKSSPADAAGEVCFTGRGRRREFPISRRPSPPPRPSSASSPGSKSRAAASARSTTSCATGSSRGNAIGASRSPSSGATAGTSCLPDAELPLEPPCRSPTSNPPAPASRPWPAPSIGFGIRTRPARETNTMPQWAGSCWYYLRYCDPHNAGPLRRNESRGALLDGRGQTRRRRSLRRRHGTRRPASALCAFLAQGACTTAAWSRPSSRSKRLVNQGLILGEDGQKMSKSKGGNVINPDDVIAGLRWPIHCVSSRCSWDRSSRPNPGAPTGVQGVHRFLARVWRLLMEEDQEGRWGLSARRSRKSRRRRSNSGLSTPPSRR